MSYEYPSGEYSPEENDAPPVAPAPSLVVPGQWSWTSEKLLWAAGIVVALGFGAWFLISFSGARARVLAEMAGDNDDE